jgi:capsular exopolysaccharide synthesis family protein
MEFIAYLRILWQHRWTILLTMVTTLAVVMLGSLLISASYASTATLRVLTSSTGINAGDRYDINYADRLMRTYAEIATSRPVLEDVAARLGLDELPTITVKVISVTELMTVSAEAPSAEQAAAVANTVAQILVERGRELYTGSAPTAASILEQRLEDTRASLERARAEYERLLREAPEDSTSLEIISQTISIHEDLYADLLTRYEEGRTADIVRANAISIVEPAITPERPVRPNLPLYVVLAAAAGLLGGGAIALVDSALDNRMVSTSEILELANAPLLARIPVIPRRRRAKLLPAHGAESEAIRQLRTNLLAHQSMGSNHNGKPPSQRGRTFLFTSAEPHEGKSLIVANLACSLAQMGRRVLVIDADMRRPTQQRLFHLPNQQGLSDHLNYTLHPRTGVKQPKCFEVNVLTSGPPVTSPSELLGTSQFSQMLAYSAQRYDVILIDSPALLAVADASIIAPLVDGVVLVVKSSTIPRPALQSAVEELQHVKARLSGVVINQSRTELNRYAHYYGHQPSHKKDGADALKQFAVSPLLHNRGVYVASTNGRSAQRRYCRYTIRGWHAGAAPRRTRPLA